MADWEFKVLIDGDCPLCKREADLLRWLDGGRGRLALEDIARPDFDPARYHTTLENVMGHIHGVLPDGSLVTGVEVFRRAYRAVGWGWLLAPTTWPLLRQLSDAGYRWFARNRLWLTRRSGACSTGRCRVPDPPRSSP